MSLRRIPTLDGWRGVAILFVLLAHFQTGYLGHYIGGHEWLDLGQHGVTIFFVLSGYLITKGLLAERNINLLRFYVRRFFRLMPAAWTYLLFLLLLTQFTPMKVIGRNDLWGCLLFYRNYIPETPLNTCTGHFWSLSLEEQFYLAWPPVLAWIGRRNGIVAVSVGAAALAVYQIFNWNYFLIGQHNLYTQARAGALLVGCLLALLLEYDTVKMWLTKWGRTLFSVFALLLAADFFWFQKLVPLHECILIALMLGATSLNPQMLVSRVLEWEHIKLTGVLSYSIYLWQQLFVRSNWGLLGPFLLMIAVGISWSCIEQPCRRLGRRF